MVFEYAGAYTAQLSFYHRLNVCIKRNAFYNFQTDESFMGRCNENKDVILCRRKCCLALKTTDKDSRV